MKRDPNQETVKGFNVSPVDLGYLALGGLAMTCYPFTRLMVGKRGWGKIGPACIVVMIFWVTMPCPEIVSFFPIWLGAVLFQRLVTLIGPHQIARYEGDCWPRYFIPFLDEQTAKLLVEPALAFAAGTALARTHHWFGQLFVVSAGAMFIRQAIKLWITRAQDDSARDTEEEMTQRMSRMRR